MRRLDKPGHLEANPRSIFSVFSVPSVLKSLQWIGADLKCSTPKAPVPLAANLHVKELICGPTPRDTHINIVARKRAGPRSSEILAIAMERQHAQNRARLRGAERRFLFFTQRAKFSCSPCDHCVRDVIRHFRRRRSRPRRIRKYVQVGERQPAAE